MNSESDAAPTERRKLPNRRMTLTRTIQWNDADYVVSVGFERSGLAREVFIKGTRPGSEIDAWADIDAFLISEALQRGNRAAELLARLTAKGHVTGEVKPTLPVLAIEVAAQLERDCAPLIEEAYGYAERHYETTPELARRAEVKPG